MSITVPTLDGLGQLQGKPAEHVQGIVQRNLFRPGTRHYSPVTYWWADWYNNETSKWRQTLSGTDALGFVILNINSGSGDSAQEDWAKQATYARNAGATVLGYVRTTKGARPKAEVLTEVQQHRDWYGVDGVFLDEAVNGWSDEEAAQVPYYQDLHDTLKATYGDRFWVVANPGSNTVEAMLSAADVLMTYESYATTYLNPGKNTITPDFYLAYPASKFWHVIHDVTEENYAQVIAAAATHHAGHLYLTDKTFVPSDDPQTPAQNPYEGPPSQWLIDIQAAWVRGTLATWQELLTLRAEVAALKKGA